MQVLDKHGAYGSIKGETWLQHAADCDRSCIVGIRYIS